VYYRDLLCPLQITISSTLLQHLSETVPMRGELCFLHSLGLEVVLLPCAYSCMPLAVVRLR
jgi:hypothetical protein